MAYSYTSKINFEKNADFLFELFISTLNTHDAEFKKVDIHSGLIQAWIPGKTYLFKSGEPSMDIEAEIIPLSKLKSKIHITIYPLSQFGNRVPTGKLGNEKRTRDKCEEIFNSLNELIRRASLK